MYQPQLGSFLTRDPLPQAGQPDLFYDNNWFGRWLDMMKNLYGYASNNPIRYVDPLGAEPNEPCCTKEEAEEFKALGGCGYTYAEWVRLYNQHVDVANELLRRFKDNVSTSFTDALRSRKAIADAGGGRAPEFADQPVFYQRAVNDLEGSWYHTAGTASIWGSEYIGSVTGFTEWLTGRPSGTGDAYYASEWRRQLWFLGRLRGIRERIEELQPKCMSACDM